MPSEDLDLDAHTAFTNNNRCNCYIEDKFNERSTQSVMIYKVQSVQSVKSDLLYDKFSILHLNVRKLQKKLDDLTALLGNLDIKFSEFYP